MACIGNIIGLSKYKGLGEVDIIQHFPSKILIKIEMDKSKIWEIVNPSNCNCKCGDKLVISEKNCSDDLMFDIALEKVNITDYKLRYEILKFLELFKQFKLCLRTRVIENVELFKLLLVSQQILEACLSRSTEHKNEVNKILDIYKDLQKYLNKKNSQILKYLVTCPKQFSCTVIQVTDGYFMVKLLSGNIVQIPQENIKIISGNPSESTESTELNESEVNEVNEVNESESESELNEGEGDEAGGCQLPREDTTNDFLNFEGEMVCGFKDTQRTSKICYLPKSQQTILNKLVKICNILDIYWTENLKLKELVGIFMNLEKKINQLKQVVEIVDQKLILIGLILLELSLNGEEHVVAINEIKRINGNENNRIRFDSIDYIVDIFKQPSVNFINQSDLQHSIFFKCNWFPFEKILKFDKQKGFLYYAMKNVTDFIIQNSNYPKLVQFSSNLHIPIKCDLNVKLTNEFKAGRVNKRKRKYSNAPRQYTEKNTKSKSILHFNSKLDF